MRAVQGGKQDLGKGRIPSKEAAGAAGVRVEGARPKGEKEASVCGGRQEAGRIAPAGRRRSGSKPQRGVALPTNPSGSVQPNVVLAGRDGDVNVQLLTPDARGAYLERIQHDIERAEHFVLVTAFATSDGIALLEPAMRKCLEADGQGTLVLALDRQHFNAADVFEKLASLVEAFPNKLEVRIVRERAGLLHAKAVFAKLPDGSATLLVGSANLTERAFTQNHELGLWVNLLGVPEVSRAFQLFAQSLSGTRHDAADLLRLIEILDGARRPVLPLMERMNANHRRRGHSPPPRRRPSRSRHSLAIGSRPVTSSGAAVAGSMCW